MLNLEMIDKKILNGVFSDLIDDAVGESIGQAPAGLF
jgi:hypothetical protein